MWQIKNFRTAEAQRRWIAANESRCQIVVLFVNNGWAVEYRKLRRVY